MPLLHHPHYRPIFRRPSVYTLTEEDEFTMDDVLDCSSCFDAEGKFKDPMYSFKDATASVLSSWDVIKGYDQHSWTASSAPHKKGNEDDNNVLPSCNPHIQALDRILQEIQYFLLDLEKSDENGLELQVDEGNEQVISEDATGELISEPFDLYSLEPATFPVEPKLEAEHQKAHETRIHFSSLFGLVRWCK